MTPEVLNLTAGTVLDCVRILRPVTITHGRSRTDTQPDAPTLAFTYAGSIPPAILSDVLSVRAPMPGTSDLQRFEGAVTSVIASGARGGVTGWEVRAVGNLAPLGSSPILLDRPAETDTARVAAILPGIRIVGDPGPMLAADTIDRDVLDALHQVCESAGGLLWSTPAGQITYGSANHRETMVRQGVIACTTILDGLQWRQDLTGVLNHVTAFWGPENEQQQSTHSDTDSIAIHGLRHVDVRTICLDEEAAGQLALLILARRARATWETSDVIIDMTALTDAETRTLLTIDVSSALVNPIPTEPGPLPGVTHSAVVEGWIETFDETGHWMQLALSDPSNWGTGALRTWAEMAEQTWAGWATGSWLNLLTEV